MLIKIAFLKWKWTDKDEKKKCIPPESSQKAGKHDVPWHTHTSKEKSFSKTKNTTNVLCLYEINFQTFPA